MNREADIGAVAQAAATEAKEDQVRRQSESDRDGEKRRKLDSPVLLVALTAVCVLLTALNLSGHGLLPRVPEPTEAELVRSLEEELEFLDMDIEAHKEDVGEVPEAIDSFVPPYAEAWSYEKLGADSYRLSLTMDGRTLEARNRVVG